MAERVVALSKEDLIAFYHKYIVGGASDRRKLVSGVQSVHHESEEARKVVLPENHGFRRGQGVEVEESLGAQVHYVSDPYEFKYELDLLASL